MVIAPDACGPLTKRDKEMLEILEREIDSKLKKEFLGEAIDIPLFPPPGYRKHPARVIQEIIKMYEMVGWSVGTVHKDEPNAEMGVSTRCYLRFYDRNSPA